MAELLKGMAVAEGMKAGLQARVEALKGQGVTPCLGIVRIGARGDDLSYERGAIKRCASVGIESRVFEFPEDIANDEFQQEFARINADPAVQGLLVFRPMPGHIDEEQVKRVIDPVKDLDCMCSENIAKVFAGDSTGYPPCTPSAVMELLRHYEIPLSGKRVALVGRSMVVGRPLAMLMMGQNATVTICHTRTQDLAGECRRADIVVAAAGKAKMLDASYVSPGAVVIDVGINVDSEGKLCGDVDFDAVEPVAGKITPVPGGVGSVTTSVLAAHLLQACESRAACSV